MKRQHGNTGIWTLKASSERRWRGQPLISHEVIVNLIAATTGLKVRASIDSGLYPRGIKVTDEEFAAIHIQRDNFHGEWNYPLY